MAIQNGPYEMVYRLGIPPEEGRYPGLAHSVRHEHGIVVERDVDVQMRDGVRLRVDVFRPIGGTDLPVILTYAPYGKHAHKSFAMFKPSNGQRDAEGDPGVTGLQLSHYTAWEGPDPLHWCQQGYAVINADTRG